MPANRFAILIGVDCHEQSADWSPLPYVRGDIGGEDGLEYVLTHDLGHGCTFRQEHVKKLIGADATSESVERELSALCESAGIDDVILTYFSGHGVVHVQGDQPVLVTYETESRVPHKTGLTFAFLEGLVRKARCKIILVIDACFSGRLLPTNQQESPSNSPCQTSDVDDTEKQLRKVLDRFGRLEGFAVFASCQSGEVSRPGLGRTQSLFTEHFVAGLRGSGSALHKGQVTTDSLRTHLEEVFQHDPNVCQQPAFLIPRDPILLSVPERPLGESPRCVTDPWTDYLETYVARYRVSPLNARGGFVDLEYEQKYLWQTHNPTGTISTGVDVVTGPRAIVPALFNIVTKQPSPSVTILLGDVGSGKSTLLWRLWFELAQAKLNCSDAETTGAMPIFVPLKRFRGVRLRDAASGPSGKAFTTSSFPQTFRGVLTDLLQYDYNLPIRWESIQRECSSRPLTILFDGLDEMALESDAKAIQDAVRLVATFAMWGARIILSCRTHFLRSDEELHKMLEATLSPGMSATIVKCKKFSPSQVKHYIDTMCATDEATARCERFVSNAFKGTEQLARRPFLLEILVNSVSYWDDSEEAIPEYRIFEEFLDGWLRRDRWRFARFLEDYRDAIERETALDVNIERPYLAPDGSTKWAEGLVRHFIEVLADDLPLERQAGISHRAIPDLIRRRFPTLPELFLNFFEYILRTCSFLVRDAKGDYSFLHSSIHAYFAACAILQEVRRDRYSWDEGLGIRAIPRALGRRPLHERIQDYLREMVTPHDEDRLFNLLQFPTRNTPNTLRYLAANALMILKDTRGGKLSGLNLSGSFIAQACLASVDLSGADLQESVFEDTNLRDAVLEGAMIEGAKLVRVDLTGARLGGIQLNNGETVVIDPTGLDTAKDVPPYSAHGN